MKIVKFITLYGFYYLGVIASTLFNQPNPTYFPSVNGYQARFVETEYTSYVNQLIADKTLNYQYYLLYLFVYPALILLILIILSVYKKKSFKLYLILIPVVFILSLLPVGNTVIDNKQMQSNRQKLINNPLPIPKIPNLNFLEAWSCAELCGKVGNLIQIPLSKDDSFNNVLNIAKFYDQNNAAKFDRTGEEIKTGGRITGFVKYDSCVDKLNKNKDKISNSPNFNSTTLECYYDISTSLRYTITLRLGKHAVLARWSYFVR